MKIPRLALAAFLFGASLSQLPVQAQCTDGHPMIEMCQSDGCFGMYDTPPPPDGGRFSDTSVQLQCCGTLYNVFTGDGGCTDVSLRSQVARDGLAALRLNGVQLMVKNCVGHFTTPTQAVIDIGHWSVDLKSTDAIHLIPRRG